MSDSDSPALASATSVAKAGLSLSDIDLIELNEAFAAQALAVMREWKFGAADRMAQRDPGAVHIGAVVVGGAELPFPHHRKRLR
ncbi:hypothetical protein MAHJHV55_52560 [Mycobacterium avium subsp. hominissuis]